MVWIYDCLINVTNIEKVKSFTPRKSCLEFFFLIKCTDLYCLEAHSRKWYSLAKDTNEVHVICKNPTTQHPNKVTLAWQTIQRKMCKQARTPSDVHLFIIFHEKTSIHGFKIYCICSEHTYALKKCHYKPPDFLDAISLTV